MRVVARKLTSLLGSDRFYWAVIIFFVIEALWIAFSANYPMAFDEDFHFGVIRIYAGKVHPFLAGQPQGANAFGALAADPSYLYHYLMSFPYRFVAAVTDNMAAQVVFLRLVNIAVITGGVVLFRKVLSRAGSSPLLVNAATLLFVLIPTVPLLAGQINYDSLLLLSLAWVCWLVLKITEDVRARRINLRTFAVFASALMLTSLVKYAFLPLALAAFVYVVFMVWREFRGRNLWGAVRKGHAGLTQGVKVGLLALLVVSGGLFIQRYGSNMVRYHSPVPPCDAVIGVESCLEYGPWARNYYFANIKTTFDHSPLAYGAQWLQGMHYRLFFMISGPPQFTNYPPSPLPSAAAVLIFVFGVVALAFYARKVFSGRPFFGFLLVMSFVYAAVLWVQNYQQYLQTGQPVAINGRYLIPLILPLSAVFGLALSIALQRVAAAKVWIVAFVILLFLQGGGVFSFILRSDESWYWPNQAVIDVNRAAQKIIDPFIFQGPTWY